MTDTNKILGEWMWGSTIADAGQNGAEKVMSFCAKMGTTDIYLLVKGTKGKLGYLNTAHTDLLSRKERDILQETIDAAHARGIRVHAWICNMEDSSYKSAHTDAGMCHYTRGRDNDKINLYDKGYREYMVSVAAELAAYDIDGLHLDYIRYNHLTNGWSEDDLRAVSEMGANVDRVKELIETTFGYNGREQNASYVFNAYKNGDPDALIIGKYRRKNVTEYAKALVSAAKAISPRLIISAALMPEGAYDEAFADLHYGQNYSDASELYDYICPMAYSSGYKAGELWTTNILKSAINKGNRVAIGLQAFEGATTERLLSEVQRARFYDDKNALGAVLFRSGTFEYAKVICNKEKNTLSVNLRNLSLSKSYESVEICAQNGIRLTEASIGSCISPNIAIELSPDGAYAKFFGENLLSPGNEGYLHLKYDGSISTSDIPAYVKITRNGELCVHNVFENN